MLSMSVYISPRKLHPPLPPPRLFDSLSGHCDIFSDLFTVAVLFQSLILPTLEYAGTFREGNCIFCRYLVNIRSNPK
jgi:hypothetical protein